MLQLDAFFIESVGGPDRPLPQQVSRGATSAAETSTIASAAADAQNNLYNNLTSALSERG
jgi:hypothetical protein